MAAALPAKVTKTAMAMMMGKSTGSIEICELKMERPIWRASKAPAENPATPPTIASSSASAKNIVETAKLPAPRAEEDFVGHFASGVDPDRARVLCAVQQGLSMSTFEDVMGVPAWKSHPSFYMVAHDEAIPPDAERMFAQRMGARTVEAASGHLAMVSHPAEVVALIKEAAEAVRRSSAESAAVAQHA